MTRLFFYILLSYFIALYQKCVKINIKFHLVFFCQKQP